MVICFVIQRMLLRNTESLPVSSPLYESIWIWKAIMCAQSIQQRAYIGLARHGINDPQSRRLLEGCLISQEKPTSKGAKWDRQNDRILSAKEQ